MNYSSNNPILDAAEAMGEAALRALRQRDEAHEAVASALELAQTCGAIATENAAEVQRLMGCIEELQAEVEILRCGELQRYFDGHLPALRHAAFERHMATCLTCKDELHGLMQEAMATSGPDA